MSSRVHFPYSQTQVKKAGQAIRRFARSDPRVDVEKYEEAIEIAKLYRAAHQYPLSKANMGLRSMVQSEQCDVEVSQRLKRWPTILDKLIVREPTLPLSSMQDIGGCRAVLASLDEIKRVETRIRKRRPVLGYSDYITTPRPSGYRGVHIVVEYDQRPIEIQLRTQAMHEWAITVEQLGSSVGKFFKSEGDHPLQTLMAAISEVTALTESGRMIDEDLRARILHLRAEALKTVKGTQ
jgi:putative GTP pyrophosphokinase